VEANTQVERKTISIMKACELVGVSRRTIYNWLSSGKVEYVRTAGGSVRIFVDTLWRDPNGAERPATPAAHDSWPAEGRNQV
jgi:excisionase family DNA binding protein